jgi:hypothetical protein
LILSPHLFIPFVVIFANMFVNTDTIIYTHFVVIFADMLVYTKKNHWNVIWNVLEVTPSIHSPHSI